MSELKERRYGLWAGNPNGYPYNPKKCASEVWGGMISGQCTRKPRTDSPYCTQHLNQIKVRESRRTARAAQGVKR